jgi:ADP-ribose pyrophosphatase YjhB (NUDIX family)
VKSYSYCPVCGAAYAPPGGAHPGTVNLLTCGACGFEFWQNSKPAVAAIALREIHGAPHVLLTKRGIDPYKGLWDLPGGYLANGEHPEHGLARELAEELGTTPAGLSLFRIEIEEYPREDVAEEARFVLALFYRCELPVDAVLVPADDVVEAAWYPLEALPFEVAFPANRRVLAALRAVVAGERRAAGGSRPA